MSKLQQDFGDFLGQRRNKYISLHIGQYYFMLVDLHESLSNNYLPISTMHFDMLPYYVIWNLYNSTEEFCATYSLVSPQANHNSF